MLPISAVTVSHAQVHIDAVFEVAEGQRASRLAHELGEVSQHAAHAGCGILLHGGFVPDFRGSFVYVSEFLCHRKNEVGYMAKVERTR